MAQAQATGEGKIAYTYSSNYGGSFETHVMNGDGTGDTEVINVGTTREPSFTADGSKLTFTSNRAGTFNIWVANSDGSGATQLTNFDFLAVQPTFSGDGRKIAFAGDGDVWVMNSDGSGALRVTDASGTEEYPSLSYDGSKLAFQSNRSGNTEIYLANGDGSGLVRLTDNSFPDEDPSVSPDGTQVAFQSNRSGNMDIYIISASGGEARRLTSDPKREEQPSWRPDGLALAYSADEGSINQEIYTINADGSGQRRLTNTSQYEAQPSWGGGSASAPPAPTPTPTSAPTPAPTPTPPPLVPRISIGDVTVDEGSSGATLARLLVTLNAPTTQAVSVPFSLVSNSALEESDFSGLSSTLTLAFAPGETQKEIVVSILSDARFEADETFFVRLGQAAGAVVERSQGVVTIRNDDLSLMVTTTADTVISGDGVTSLREALLAANALAGPSVISFAIPRSDAGYTGGAFSIRPTSTLPPLDGNGTTIDGSTQTTFGGNTNLAGPEIVLNGALAGPSDGLSILASGCVVRNLIINGFRGSGVLISGGGARGNVIEGCFLGTNAGGSSAVPNLRSGVSISDGAQNNVVGRASGALSNRAAGRNTISGNSFGVTITGASTSGNRVQNNFIGTNASGIARLSNNNYGVYIHDAAHNNLVGGASSGAGNVISGNGQWGLYFGGVDTRNNVVQGNFIGTDASGTFAISQTLGIVLQDGVQNTLIGGTTPGARNLISGHQASGIYLFSANTIGTTIQNNLIGTDASGLRVLGNGLGITVDGGARATVGTLGAGNVIANNRSSGVRVAGAATVASIRGNSIFNNGGLGIDLNGDFVSPNDVLDADAGPNEGQNYPVITRAENGAIAVVSGTLSSAPSTSYAIDFYFSSARDASGQGEGTAYAGSTLVRTNAQGEASFRFAQRSRAGFVSAIATNLATGASSEFSRALAVPPPASLFLSLNRGGVLENATGASGAVMGTVSRGVATASALSSPLVVSLLSSDVSEARVPARVVIPAGARSVTFPIVPVDDAFADGTQRVSVQANAVGIPFPATATLSVLDNERATLSLALSAARVSAGGESVVATLSRNSQPGPSLPALSVRLFASRPGLLRMPVLVVIPVGATSVRFPISAQAGATGSVPVTITGASAGYAAGATQLLVVGSSAGA